MMSHRVTDYVHCEYDFNARATFFTYCIHIRYGWLNKTKQFLTIDSWYYVESVSHLTCENANKILYLESYRTFGSTSGQWSPSR